MGEMRGQKKPVELHKLQGTYREDRHGSSGFKAQTLSADPPEWMNENAKDIWRKYYEMLSEVEVLKTTDEEAFSRLCIETALYRQMTQELQNEEIVTEMTNQGGFTYYRRNAKLDIRNKALDNLHKLEAKFGLTPADRSKIRIKENTDDPKDEFSQF